jgi:HlyD family secretion protein
MKGTQVMPVKSVVALAIMVPVVALVVSAVEPEPPAAGSSTFALSRLFKANSGDSAREYVYQTAKISHGTVRRKVQTTGTVRPLVTVQVGSQLSGQVKRVFADFNASVKEGDVLAVLDDQSFSARVAQAEADLVTAEASLASQEAALKKAIANLRQAERANKRLQELADKGHSSVSQAETASRDAEVAAVEIDVTKSQIEVAKGAVLHRKALLRQAQIDLERTQIRAPIDGVVISRTVEVGQTVAASLQAPELFRIAQDLKQITIEAQVNEADIGGVQPGNPVAFKVDAHREHTFQGKVNQVRLSGVEEQSVVSYTVVISADNEDLKLYPGMTANVEIELDKRENVVRVPAEALRYQPRGAEKEQRDSKVERRLEKLDSVKEALNLTEAQVAAARKALDALATQELASKKSEQAGSQEGIKRTSSTEVIEAALTPLLTEAQTESLAKWKAGRELSDSGKIWVVGADGQPEKRSVRVGLVDDKFAELVNFESIKKGELIIVRSSLASKQ